MKGGSSERRHGADGLAHRFENLDDACSEYSYMRFRFLPVAVGYSHTLIEYSRAFIKHLRAAIERPHTSVKHSPTAVVHPLAFIERLPAFIKHLCATVKHLHLPNELPLL